MIRFGLLLLASASSILVRGAALAVLMDHAWESQPLAIGPLEYKDGDGSLLSVTRLDYLLSDFSFESSDGPEVVLTNQFAYVSAGTGRCRFILTNLPVQTFNTIRFSVGVGADDNHSDPTRLGPTHPLNPIVDGLRWNWQGGYVFLALEGAWRKPDGQFSGYSYHLATDRLRMRIRLPVALKATEGQELRLRFKVHDLFSSPNRLGLRIDSTSTHSRVGDALADQLRENVEHAFSVGAIGTARLLPSSTETGAAQKAGFEMGDHTTPYRLSFSRFFPTPNLPLDNPLTEEGVELGRHLFNDPTLSINDRQSCASCHRVASAFSDTVRFSVGAEGESGTRNAMPLENLAWKTSFFWDGRAANLREQVLQPIQNPLEMHETLEHVVLKLARCVSNQVLFARAFGTPEISADRVARALEQFLLTRVSHPAKFDHSLRGEVELTAEEKHGFELFHTEYDPRHEQYGADCFHCHGGLLFQSQTFANNGLDQTSQDRGRARISGKQIDEGKFAVPSLRNVALTAPYMHDGRFATLEEVVAHYCTGVQRSPTLDPNLAKHPDGGVPLGAADQRSLVAFLRTLTSDDASATNNATGNNTVRSWGASSPLALWLSRDQYGVIK